MTAMRPASLIPPMLCSRLENPGALADRRYTAEPKLDGQRAQAHIRGGRTVACYSRPGRDLLRHQGMSWLRAITWPVDAAVLDSEACAGDGPEGDSNPCLRSAPRASLFRQYVN
jgi:ATP-dependent DNA ligase